MRSLLTSLLVLFLAALSAQTRVDTSYWPAGTIKSLRYMHEIKLVELSPAERFQRGLSTADPYEKIYQTDSIVRFDREDGYRYTTHSKMQVNPDTGRSFYRRAPPNRAPVDTTYGKFGQIEQLRFYEVTEVETVPGKTSVRRQLDSIRWHNEFGEYVTTKHFGKDGPKSYNSVRNRLNSQQRAELAWHKTAENDYVEGRAEMRTLRRAMLPPGKTLKSAHRLDESPELELISTGGEGLAEGFNVRVSIPAGATNRKLRLDLGEERVWEKPYTIRGYHLNETDFKRRDQLTEAQTWRAEGQEYLYLRLRSTEKLMHIYRDNEQYTVLPVGRQLDEVRIGALPAGKYLLEIIDLGTREKRYHWIVVGK